MVSPHSETAAVGYSTENLALVAERRPDRRYQSGRSSSCHIGYYWTGRSGHIRDETVTPLTKDGPDKLQLQARLPPIQEGRTQYPPRLVSLQWEHVYVSLDHPTGFDDIRSHPPQDGMHPFLYARETAVTVQ